MPSKNDIEQLIQLAFANHENGNLDRAEVIYNQIISLDPNYMNAKIYKAKLLLQENRYQEAVELLKSCHQENKKNTDIILDYAFALYQTGQLNDAKKMYETLLRIEPNHLNGLLQYSTLLCCLDQLSPKVIEICEHLVSLQPDNPSTHYHLGKMYLYAGELQKGWRECEWRWQETKYTTEHKRSFSQPYWHKESLDGKTLVIEFEQGVGDSIQFSRYLFLLLKDHPKAHFIFTVEKNLFDLFTFTFRDYQNIDIIKMEKNVVMSFYYDYHFPLMSLPNLYQTSLETIPSDIPYIFPRKPKNYKDDGHDLIIGIAWFSKAPQVGKRRSITLEKLSSLNISEKIKWIDLQYGDTTTERKTVYDKTGWEIFHDNSVEQLDSLMDFVDQIAACDLIISIDNTTVHMAAAMGKEVWTLLPLFCDFRWMTKRNDTPWYPSMTLFRQTKYGCWDTVLESIKNALQNRIQ